MFSYKNHTLLFFSVAQLFLSLSLLFGTWVIYIPHITEKLSMSEGQLGVTLLFGAVASLTGTFLGKKLTITFGEGKTSLYSIIAVSLSSILLFTAGSYYYLTAAMFLFGLFGGIFQVSVNTLVVSIENIFKLTIMSSCHAFFSLGAMIAAGFGTMLMVFIKNPLIHIILAVSIVIGLQIVFMKFYSETKHDANTDNKSLEKPKSKVWILLGIALIGISAMVSEGAIADWSGLFLKDIANTKNEYLGLGYAGFSLAMTIGRFSGDFISKRYGSIPIIIGGFLISALGFITVLFAQPLISIIGFFIIGSGLSFIVPEVYRLSANIDGVSPSAGIAFIAGSAYVGFLAGPVLLGFIAEKYDLNISFIFLLGLVVFGVILSFVYNMAMGLKTKKKLNPKTI